MGKGKSTRDDTRRAIRQGIVLVAANVVVLAVAAALLEFGTGLGPLTFPDVISICALLSTIVVGMLALLPNLKSLQRALEDSAESMRSSHYSELDNIYMDILGLALERPFLRRPSQGLTKEQAGPYETYAFLVWNFLETIHDRAKSHAELQRTWAPIVVSEAKLHWTWFEAENSCDEALGAPKFCVEFCDFVHRHQRDGFRDLLDDPARNALWAYRTVPRDAEGRPWYCKPAGDEARTI